MKIAHKLFGETRGINQYDLVKEQLHTIPHTEIINSERETKIIFDDKSYLMLENRGYEKAVLLSLFGGM